MTKRREKGEGSVFQTKNGKWRAVVELTKRDENGKKKTKTFTGNSKSEVNKRLKAWKEEQEKFSVESVQRMTLSTYITNWLNLYKQPSLKPSSYIRLKSSVDTHVIPNIGHISIRELSTDDIQGLIADLSKSTDPQYSFSSIKKVRDAINSCLQDGVRKGDFAFNVCSAVKLPSIDKRKPVKQIRVFSGDEKERIVTECLRRYKNGKSVYYYGAAYILILNTGLRLGETLALSWDNVDFENKYMHIDSTLSRLKDKDNNSYLTVQKSTKTSSGIRDIPLNETAIQALKILKKNNSRTFVLENPNHNHVSTENFERTFYRILEHCSISKCGIHCLRHTFATDLFTKGVDLKTISSLLGHASISVTANIYVSVIKDIKQDSVNLLDNDYKVYNS